ncbi:hypothetical protein TWF506_004688 [Arthrobotrys conoides]|uniref:F-box domain-containing protein n=1 Tax=Arthrobotrys conoides TaxID=74498 RepID=A0AAN8N9S4_9PEZI
MSSSPSPSTSLSATFSTLTLQPHPPPSSPPSKTNPLLIPELLEIILTTLPQLTVLTTCRSICTLWREVIDTSPLLKYTTWRTESIPGRTPPRITVKNYRRNPIVLDVLSHFWWRLNNLPDHNNPPDDDIDIDSTTTTTSNVKKKKKKNDIQKLHIPTFLHPYQQICTTQIFSNSSPLDVTIRITLQKYTTKHIIARSYRSISTDIGTGWITDLSVLINLMEEILELRNEGVYVDGKRNSLQAEIGWCVFLYTEEGKEGGKRRECEVAEKVDFECVEPWGVGILEGRVREVG